MEGWSESLGKGPRKSGWQCLICSTPGNWASTSHCRICGNPSPMWWMAKGDWEQKQKRKSWNVDTLS
eukprot:877291-Heterocapsa_arctica.AAC.1